MSTGSFTAGPWAISGVLEGRGDITISSGRLVVATAHNGVSFFDVINSRDPEQQWANARLIAAAPNLLEALRNVVNEHGARYLNGTDDRLMPSHRQSPSIRNAMEEIAKATGEQP